MQPTEPSNEPGGQAAPSRPTAETPWSVATVADHIHAWVGRLGSVWIEGELTGWNVRGGHAYGKLRDLERDASLSITVWRSVVQQLDSEFKQGDRVVALAKPDFWVKGGQLSLQVSDIRHVGIGDLLERLERLRRQLAAEGLFDESRKKTLPFLPSRIGLVTGKDSDAERDVLRNAELRWPAVDFRVINTSVQGARTVDEVSAALRELDADPTIDVIIVARGGGDFLHLLPFSDESLVRLVASLSTPVVSAIGHERDRPILDEVADLRASTPTDAAKRVVPDVAEELARVHDARARMFQRVASLVANETRALENVRSRPVLANPEWLVDQHTDVIGRYASRGEELVTRIVEREADRVDSLRRHLTALSPQRTLDRGYAIVERVDGDAADAVDAASGAARRVVRSFEEAPEGADLRIRLADGRAFATVTASEPVAR